MIVILSVIIVCLFASQAHCQDIQNTINEVAKNYTGNGALKNGLIAGFSLGGLIGGFLFGGIGFIAFIYGKRNLVFRTLTIGILLMAYPYFVRNTIAVYLVGAALTAALFIFRE
ncbi:MAG: hypothetical protein ABH843_04170 [Candidatus Omnitrophota bacterium]